MPLKTGKGPPKGASTITHSLSLIALPKHHQWHTFQTSGANVANLMIQASFFHRFFIIGGSI